MASACSNSRAAAALSVSMSRIVVGLSVVMVKGAPFRCGKGRLGVSSTLAARWACRPRVAPEGHCRASHGPQSRQSRRELLGPIPVVAVAAGGHRVDEVHQVLVGAAELGRPVPIDCVATLDRIPAGLVNAHRLVVCPCQLLLCPDVHFLLPTAAFCWAGTSSGRAPGSGRDSGCWRILVL